MNKLIKLIGLALLCALPAFGQAHNNGWSFFNDGVASITVSNTVQYTNTSSRTSVGTNWVGLIYTNGVGTRVVIGSSGGTNNTGTKLTKDLPLWVNREGTGWSVPYWHTNGVVGPWTATPATLLIELSGGSGANQPLQVVLTPLPDGTTETSGTTEDWTVGVTATGATAVCIRTNLPFWLWNGCGKLRVKRIVDGDADASSQVAVTKLELCGFPP